MITHAQKCTRGKAYPSNLWMVWVDEQSKEGNRLTIQALIQPDGNRLVLFTMFSCLATQLQGDLVGLLQQQLLTALVRIDPQHGRHIARSDANGATHCVPFLASLSDVWQ